MISQPTKIPVNNADDEAAVSAIPMRMIDAWNKGDGAAFAASFTEHADFVAFEGTHLKGHQEIVSFHQHIFDTVVKGSRLEGEVKFVRFLSPQLAVMHAVCGTILPGQTKPSPGRDSMQLFVVAKRTEGWRVEALLNARKLTMERQYLLDEIDALPAAAQSQVAAFVASLKQR
jgi:uncharacterized protein (TIGR02246 family)